MTHNDFDFYEDLIRPLMRFLCQINILQNGEESDSDDTDHDMIDTTRLMSPTQAIKSPMSATATIRTTFVNPGTVSREEGQLKFPEEFFIPPNLKYSYRKCQTAAATLVSLGS